MEALFIFQETLFHSFSNRGFKIIYSEGYKFLTIIHLTQLTCGHSHFKLDILTEIFQLLDLHKSFKIAVKMPNLKWGGDFVE